MEKIFLMQPHDEIFSVRGFLARLTIFVTLYMCSEGTLCLTLTNFLMHSKKLGSHFFDNIPYGKSTMGACCNSFFRPNAQITNI
jgi:hypothetical protein